jgi:hypothetical protein
MKTRSFRSSSTSISFWLPFAGCAIVSVCSWIRDGIFRDGKAVETHEGDILARAQVSNVHN